MQGGVVARARSRASRNPRSTAGGSTTSAAVPVSVGNLAGTPIGISLSSPSAGQTQPAPAGLILAASVSDSSGTITQVAFYDNSKLLVTYYQAPYTLVIPYALAGTHSYTVQAIDNQGASAASAPVSFIVTPPGPLAISLVNANLGANPAGTAYSMVGAYNGDASNGSLAVDPQGNSYITAYNKDYVQQIKPDNSPGMVRHGLNAPQGILFAKDNSGVLVGTASGLIHLGFDGSITTVNSNPDLGRPYYGPNGVIYTAHGASNTIYQLDGNGQASVYLPSNTVVGAQSMAFDSTGNMLLAVYDSNRIVRVNPDKSVQTVLNINGALSILPYGQGWLIGTDSGNNLVDGQWQTVTPLSNTRSDNLIVQANGTVYGAGYGGNGTQKLIQSPANPAQTSGTNAIAMNSPSSLMLSATSLDSAGSVNQLGFYVNGSLMGTTSPAPYTFNWNNILPGS